MSGGTGTGGSALTGGLGSGGFGDSPTNGDGDGGDGSGNYQDPHRNQSETFQDIPQVVQPVELSAGEGGDLLEKTAVSLPEVWKNQTVQQLEEMVASGQAFQRGEYIGFYIINDYGYVRLVVYKYQEAWSPPDCNPYVAGSGASIPSSASYFENLPGNGWGAFGQDYAGDASKLYIKANLMTAAMVVQVVLVPVGALEAGAIATAGGYSSLTGVTIFGVSEVGSTYLEVPIPINPASLLTIRNLVRTNLSNTLENGLKNSDGLLAPRATAHGSGPASGLLEVSKNYKSSGAVKNFRSEKGADFVYAPNEGRFFGFPN